MLKTHINDASGNFALFIDSEGNRLALHEGPTRSGAAVKAAKTASARTGGKAGVKKVSSKKAAPKKVVKMSSSYTSGKAAKRPRPAAAGKKR